MYPIIRMASTKEIEIGDLFTISKEFESKELQQKLQKYVFNREFITTLLDVYNIFLPQSNRQPIW